MYASLNQGNIDSLKEEKSDRNRDILDRMIEKERKKEKLFFNATSSFLLEN